MSRIHRVRRRTKQIGLILASFVAVAIFVQYISQPASGAQLGSRKLYLSTNVAGATADYYLSFHTATAGNIGSINILFCANSPFPSDPCVPPVGFNALNTALTNQTGITGFSIDGISNANRILLTRNMVMAPVTAASYDFSNIVNPANAGSYFVRLQTYATEDASGLASDYGGIAFAITEDVSITATVPPYLTFCAANVIVGTDCSQATGQYVQLGELSPFAPTTGTSQFLVTTNAGVGYSVTISGPQMASGINGLTSLLFPDISRPGTSQFGLNVVKNNSPASGFDPQGPGSGAPNAGYNTPDVFKFNSGDALVSHSGTELPRTYTVTYMVNVPSNQAPGIYVTTLTYVCLAQF